MKNATNQLVEYVDDNTDIFPMNRINAGHYQRKIGKTNFEAFRSDAEDVQQTGPRRWFGVVDGVVVAQGPNYRSVKVALVQNGYVERAEANAEVMEKRLAAQQTFSEVYGEIIPPQARKRLEQSYGELVDVIPAKVRQ